MKRFNNSHEGAPISATNENARNRAIRQGQVITGPGLLSRVTSQGTVIYMAPQPTKRTKKDRAAYACGASGSDITAGAVCGVDTLVSDNAPGTAPEVIAASAIVSVSGGALTFLQTGLYLVSYTASLELEAKLAETHIPAAVNAKTTLRAGGADVEGTEGFASQLQIPNFKGFVTAPIGGIEQSVSLAGVKASTEVLPVLPAIVNPDTLVAKSVAGLGDDDTISFSYSTTTDVVSASGSSPTDNTLFLVWMDEVNPGSDSNLTLAPIETNLAPVDVVPYPIPSENQADVIDFETLGGDLILRTTIDATGQPEDWDQVTSNLEVTDEYTVTGVVGKFTTSGQALIRVIMARSPGDPPEADPTIKILGLDGTSILSPTLDVFGTCESDGDVGSATCVGVSILIHSIS